jgi:oxygen-independent coproporphyrinogen-3 oxidase
LVFPEPEETGNTFAENAALKAEAAARSASLPALSDDSGLSVAALNGAPGIYSARWAGPTKDFRVAMRRVEEELRATESHDVRAYFVCVLAFAAPGEQTQTYEGRVYGSLSFPPRGDKGFGYEPRFFVPEGYRFTFGEMGAGRQACDVASREGVRKIRRRGDCSGCGTMSGFGIYVHWPFCAAKCPYCDFNSHVRERYDETRWAAAIARELAAVADLQGVARPEVGSVFFGGGTPSLMSGKRSVACSMPSRGFGRLLRTWKSPSKPIPTAPKQAAFAITVPAGVNRLSIGVQSLREESLRALGRLHGVGEAKQAIQLAQATFPRVSFDLIYARPARPRRHGKTSWRKPSSLKTEHLSLYQLTIEPGTAYATLARQGKLQVPDENAAAELYELTQLICERAGLPAYEVSNHSRPGAASRHNLTYWKYYDYAGVGPGAHGRLTISERRLATYSERLPEKWLEIRRATGQRDSRSWKWPALMPLTSIY